MNFEPEADFGFLLSVYSDDVHVLKCSQKLFADSNDSIKLGRGLNQIYITKKLGVDYYNATVDARGTIPEELLTDSNVACNSKYIMWSPGGDRSPVNFVPNGGGSYPRDPWVYFEFFSPVCVTKLSVDVFENWNYPTCVFYGSNDGKNWTILLDRSGESSGAHGDLYPDVKGFYRFFKFNLVSDSRWGYMSSFRMYGYHLNNPMQTVTMLNRIATTTASGVEEGSNINNLVNDDANTLIYVTPDENGKKWIKWEFEQPQFVNIFRLDFQRPDNYDRQVSWFKLEASEDGEEWELLFERNSLEIEDFKNNHSKYWHLNPEKAYKFYRVVCERTNDFRYENWMIYGVKFYQIEDGRAIVQKIVPEMNSASQDGFEVTASSIYADDHAAYYAFDDNPNTRWGAKDYDNQWLQIKLADPAVVNAVEMRARVCCPVQMPKSFAILASDDGENFTELFATEDAEAWQSSEKRTYTFDNTTSYLYYRLKINSSHDGRTIALSCLNFGNATREYKRELHVFDYIIPLLLGDETTTNEGVYKISSSSEHSEHKRYYLFDRDFGTRFETDGTPDGWIQIELPVAKVVNYYQVGARNDSWCSAAPRKI